MAKTVIGNAEYKIKAGLGKLDFPKTEQLYLSYTDSISLAGAQTVQTTTLITSVSFPFNCILDKVIFDCSMYNAANTAAKPVTLFRGIVNLPASAYYQPPAIVGATFSNFLRITGSPQEKTLDRSVEIFIPATQTISVTVAGYFPAAVLNDLIVFDVTLGISRI